MSDRDFAEFVEKINSDDDLRAALEGRFGDLSEDIPQDELIEFADEHGYSFTVDEAARELSDEELEGVAGGLKVTNTDVLTPSLSLKFSPADQSFNFLKLG